MKKGTIWSVGIGFAALALMLGTTSVNAVTAPISLGTPSGSSTAAGATNVTYTVTMTVNTAIPADSDLTFRFRGNVPWDQGFDLSNSTVTIAGVTGTSQNASSVDYMSADNVNFRPTGNIGTGTKTVTLSGVINPSATGLYTLGVELRVPGTEGPGTEYQASAAIPVGNIAVMGQVKLPNGTPATGVTGVGVNVRTADFSQNFGTSVDDNGIFVFPVQGQQGNFVSGTTYFIDLWAGNTEGVTSPDPVSFVYSGSMVTKNLSFVTAAKTLTVRVKYADGSAVTTASVWANKRDGGGGAGGDVNSSGIKSLSVTGGSWDVNVNCGWNQETQMPYECDWAYNQPPQTVTFASDSSTETKTVTITVEKTNAVINGTVYLPDGVTKMSGGWVDIRASSTGGNGSGLNNGAFRANVKAGDYKVSVHPDNMNSSLARYYSDEISVRVGENETKTLRIVMKEKTSRITGRVVDTAGNGVANVWVNGWVRNGQGWGNTQSGANGTFSMYVSPGEWEVMVDQGRPGDDSGAKYIPADNRPMTATVAANQTVSNIVLKVQVADATVNVKVVDASGNAITNMFGYAFCRKVGAGFGPGSEFGSGVDRGTASVSLLGGFTYTCGMHMPPEGDRSLDKEVEVAVGVGQSKEVKLTLVENDSTIVGWVKDQSGNLVTNVEGEVFAVEAGNWQWRPGQLNADGSFRISVRGGATKKFMVGVNFWNRENSEYMETHPEPDSAFTVPANSNVQKVITVYKADTYISGTVVDPDGNPMSHVWVNADNFRAMEDKMQGDFEGGKGFNAGTETRGDGTFTLRIVSGTYMLMSGMPPEYQGTFMSPKEQEVTVTSSTPATGVMLRYREADAFVNAMAKFEDGALPQMGFCHAWSEEGGNSGKEAFGGSALIPLTAGTWWIGCDSFNPSTNQFYRSSEQQVTVAKGDTKSKEFVLQEARFTIPESFTQTFVATQQNVFTLPDGTSVTIPQNAAGTDESTYTIKATPSTNLFFTETDKPLTFAWDFEVTKQSESSTELVTTFNSNVTICMPLPLGYMEELGLSIDDIFSKYWDETSGTWKRPSSVVVNEEEGTACLQVDHFTEFAITSSATFGAAANAGGPQYVVATPAADGGPQVTVYDQAGTMKLGFMAYASTSRFGIKALTGDIDGDGTDEIVVLPTGPAAPHLRIFDLEGNFIRHFYVYAETLRTGYDFALADMDGDGDDDIIVVTLANGGPQVRVLDGQGNVLSQFFAYNAAFRGGLTITTADVDGDGVAEIITAPASNGGPQVRVFNADGSVVSQFFAYAMTIRGGYNLTTADEDGDGIEEIIVGPKSGLGPQVVIFNGEGELVRRFFVYATSFRGGIRLSAGDVNGDGADELVVTPDSNGGPQVRVFSLDGTSLSQFFAYATTLRGSFTTMVADVDEDGSDDIVVAPGSGMGPHVRAFTSTGDVVAQYFTHHRGFRGGLNISSVPVF